MALPITGGDQQPIVKYNAKAAKWKVDDKLLNAITMIIDMDSVEIGWSKFTEGMAPEFEMVLARSFEDRQGAVPDAPRRGRREGPMFRRGFRVTVKLSDKVAGNATVREWASNSLATCRGFGDLDDLWQAERAAHDGQVPVVKMTGVETMTGQYGDNFNPFFEIVQLDRSAGGPQVQRRANDAGGRATTASIDDDPDDFSDLEDGDDTFREAKGRGRPPARLSPSGTPG